MESALETASKSPTDRRPMRGSPSGESPESMPSSSAAPGRSTELIARRAYELFQQRGGEHGYDIDDWLQAERELADSTRDQERGTPRQVTPDL